MINTIPRALAIAAGIIGTSLLASAAADSGLIGADAPERLLGALFGLILAGIGNGLPKHLGPLSDDRCGPARAQSYRRRAAWAFVLAGLGSALAWLFLPMSIASPVATGLIASSVVLVAGFCLVARRSSGARA